MIITPRFILAGSSAQLDMPTKATLSSLAIYCNKQNVKFQNHQFHFIGPANMQLQWVEKVNLMFCHCY